MKPFAIVFGICAAALPASAADGGFWPPQITRETLAASLSLPGVPAAVAERENGEGIPHDGTNYSAAEEILIKEFGVRAVKLDIPEAEVSIQMTNPANRLGFDQAFRFAVKSFLEDHADPASPLSAILASMGASTVQPTKQELNLAKQKLLQLVNLPGAALLIVRESGPNQAARGERVKENWISQLRLGYPGRTHWAIVDRSGETPAYNYGLK